MTDDPGLVARLRALYDEAECFARRVGEFRSTVPIPAHNELRYAGYHLLKGLGDDGQVVDAAEIERAIQHCKRAMYEAAEAGILQAIQEFKEFRLEYKGIVIGTTVDSYTQMRVRANRARDLVIKGRNDRDSVVAQVKEYMDAFQGLSDDIDILNASREDLNTQREKDVRASRRFWVTIVVTVSMATIGILIRVLLA